MHAQPTALLAVSVAWACGGAQPAPSPAPAAEPSAAPPAASPPAKEVRVDLGQGAGGGLTAEQILTTVKARRGDIDACYEAELQQRSSLAGKVVVSWRIAADGRTQDVELKSTTLNNTTVERCVLDQVAALVFPPPTGGKLVQVSFPLIFKPGR